MTIQELVDQITARTHNHPQMMRYKVVAVLNPGDGPDERILDVSDVGWDYDLGVIRLEIAE